MQALGKEEVVVEQVIMDDNIEIPETPKVFKTL